MHRLRQLGPFVGIIVICSLLAYAERHPRQWKRWPAGTSPRESREARGGTFCHYPAYKLGETRSQRAFHCISRVDGMVWRADIRTSERR